MYGFGADMSNHELMNQVGLDPKKSSNTSTNIRKQEH